MSNRRKLKPPKTPLPKASTVTEANPTGTFWNGLPTPAMRGTAVVADAPEFPLYWARTEGIVGLRIPVVLVVLEGVNAGGGISYLDDRDGSGWYKVTEGHGSPSYGDKGVAIEPGSFVPSAVER